MTENLCTMKKITKKREWRLDPFKKEGEDNTEVDPTTIVAI